MKTEIKEQILKSWDFGKDHPKAKSDLLNYEVEEIIDETIDETAKAIFQDIEDLKLELFLTDLKDKETGKIIEIPKDIRIILEKFTDHVQNKLKEKIREKCIGG